MAEEQKNPEEEQEQSRLAQEVEEAQAAVEDDLPDFVDNAGDVVEDVAKTIDEKMDDAQDAIEGAAAKVMDAVSSSDDAETEDYDDKVRDSLEEIAEDEDAKAVLEADGDKLSFMEAGEVATREHNDDHHYSDDVVIPYFGHVGTMPGGIYTFIFLVLGGLTLIEVAITLIGENTFTITLLVLLSIVKAYLVIMYYMHLKDDNPLYRLVVILPLIIVLLSTLYLLGVPAGAGLGYN